MQQPDLYDEKGRFVCLELTDMLKAATHGVVSECMFERDDAQETVHVFTVTQPFAVNVTGDSLWSTAKDVMKAVAERYE